MKTVLRGGKLYKDGALTDNGSFEISDVTNMNDCDEKRVIELDTLLFCHLSVMCMSISENRDSDTRRPSGREAWPEPEADTR